MKRLIICAILLTACATPAPAPASTVTPPPTPTRALTASPVPTLAPTATNVTRTSTPSHAPTASLTSSNKILFTSKRDGRSQIYVMNADGSGQTNLSRNDSNDLSPSWSPNNKQIVFNTSEGVFVMNADGSGRKRLAEGSSPTWLPLRGIAFVFPGDTGSVMYVMNSDGSGQSMLWKQDIYNGQSGSPKWNREGTRAVFRHVSQWQRGCV